MTTHEPRIPTADWLIAVLLAVLGVLFIAGAVVYTAPLMLAQGWASFRALVFLGTSGAALALCVYSVLGLAQTLRRR